MRFLSLTLALLAGLLVAAPARAAETWTVEGPGPEATFSLDADGSLTLAVTRGPTTVLEPSPVGIVTAGADLSTGLRLVDRTSRQVRERYRTTVGKELRRKARMRESVFSFESEDGARLDVVVRVAPDGVAYRYVLPEDHGNVLREASAFNLPADASAWLAEHRRDYENPFVEYTAADAPSQDYMTPALFSVDGTYLLIAESALDGSYSGSRLSHEQGAPRYAVELWDEEVEVDGELATPWRAMIVGDLATVTESTLVDDLAPAARLDDTGWIDPGVVLWTWIAGGRAAGQSLDIQKGYVDYASERGWPYVAVDAGWYFLPDAWDVTDPNWQENSWIPELVRYAEARRTEIIVWIHYRDLDTEAERDQWLPTLEEWGVKGVKIDFMDSESQVRLRWYDEVLADTAEHHLLVNFHGSNIPKGIHRTWPHVMTMEGVHGEEKGARVTSDHVVTLPYTRNVVGSMDFTPMAFHRDTRPTTDAGELALAVLYESGLQNLAGTPESYEERPEAVRFLEQVPAVWDDTRMLAGHPADSAVLARRSGKRWFVGGTFAGPDRTVDVPLDIGRGRWLVELVRDGDDGLVTEQRVLRGGQELTLDVTDGGGFAAIACRYRARVRTCDRPVEAVPETTLEAEPEAAQVAAGGSFGVTARFTLDEWDRLRDVELAPRAPDGWTVDGEPARARNLFPGDTLEGTWTVTVPEGAEPGEVDLPIVATFRDRRGRAEAETRVPVHLLPEGWLRIYEAEDATMAGAVRAGGCAACSGDEKVRFIGDGAENTLTFADVQAPAAGEYELLVDATVDGTRSFFVTAGDSEPVEVPVTGSSWDEPTTATVDVGLREGANTIRFGNEAGHAPDLDRIVLAEPLEVELTAEDTSLPLDGTTSIRVASEADLADAEITVTTSEEGWAFATMDGAEGVLRAGTMGPGTTTLTARVTLNGRTATDELEIELLPEPARPYVHDYHQTVTMKMFMADREGDVSLTFEEGLEVIRKVDNLTRGIPKIFYLVGWQYNGHDTGYPAWDVVNPSLKRPQDETALDSLRWLIEEARRYDTTVSFHVNMLDASRESPLWQEYVDKDVLARNEDGSLREYVWGHPISYTREWDEGLAQRRIDQLFEMFPMERIGTIHIDALHQYIPGQGEGPISPYHDISTDQEIETQKKIIRSFRDRGVDVTSEFAYSYRKDPLLGLQPMSWHFRDVDQMEIPPTLHIGGAGGDPRFGESMQGEGIIRDDPETLDGFLDEFATTTLLWHYLNRLERISDEDGVVTFSDGVTSTAEITRQGDVLLRDGDDVFVPAQWREQEIIAYSGEGYLDRTWRLPAEWDDVRRVDLYRIGLDGLTRVDRKVRVRDGELVLSLPAGWAVSVVPAGTKVDADKDSPHMFGARSPDAGATGVNPRRVRFAWDRSRKADEYRLLVDDDPQFGSPVIDFPTQRTKVVSGALEDGTDYFWRVVASNEHGSIAIDGAPLRFRTAFTEPPAKPSGVTAYRMSADSVFVTWDETSGAGTYTVERRAPDGEFEVVAEGVEVTSFTDSGEGPFEYRVIAVNDLGAGEPSDIATEQAVGEGRYLSDVDWESATSGWRTVQRDRSVGGNPLRLGGTTYEKGLGTHAESEIVYRLLPDDKLFRAVVGIDDESEGSPGSIAFQVLLDGEPVYDSGTMLADPYTAPKEVLVDVAGHETLTLVVADAGDGINSDHGDWADAQLFGAAQEPFEKLPLAETPPMGWNSWNNFHCDIDEDLIRETADAMVASGMKDAGYEYVNIDDCWMAPERTADGYLQADPERFPGGIKALADYVHARGLKLGIYQSAGTRTCQGLPGSLGHEEKDAQKFAEWEVDLLKYDNCNNEGVPAKQRYRTMAEALKETGRPIVFSICEWGENDPWLWAGEYGHYWRTTGDIRDTWGSMVSILDQQVGLEAYSGPHGWNDPDMLEVGNGGMTTREYRSHMSLWALLNAPLLAGNDLRSMDEETRSILTDPDVIAVDQDWGGIQGHKIADAGDQEVWMKPMSDGGSAVVLFNRGPAAAEVSTTAADLGLDAAEAYALDDVWSDETTETSGAVRASIPSHGSRMFIVRAAEPGAHPPAAFLDVTTDTNGFVTAGQSFTATVAFTNEGTTAVRDVELALTAPDGWTAEPQGETRFDSVAGGETVRAQFGMTVPADAPEGSFELAASGGPVTGSATVTIATPPSGEPHLSDLDPLTVATGFGDMGIDESVDGNPITIDGVRYEKGIAPHAASEVTYHLGGRCTRFTTDVGIDDETSERGTVTFHVLGDDRDVLAETGVVSGGERARSLTVDVTGVTVLTLVTGIGPDNNNHDHSEWASARLDCDSAGDPQPLSPADPGFEDGGGAWQLAGGAQVSDAAPKTGTRHAQLPAGASASQSLAAPRDGRFVLSVWADGGSGSQLTVSVGGEPVATAPVREAGFYTRLTLPAFAVQEGDAVEIAARAGTGELRVDDFMVSPAAPADPKATSSNAKLAELFEWAKLKANSWVHQPGVVGPVNVDERNPAGTGERPYDATYWAGYAHRSGYYSRDFAHQLVGAEVLGLATENKTMLRSFAASSTEAHKHYPVWAINFDAETFLSIDYRGTTSFVREVPAPFELVEKANTAYRWSGDAAYLDDAVLWDFYRRVTDDFITAHDARKPNRVAEGTGEGIFQGTASYNEQSDEPLAEAGDGIGAQYQAFRAMAALARDKGDAALADRFGGLADELKRYFNEEWSGTGSGADFVRAYLTSGEPVTGWGKENSWFMPMKKIIEAGPRNDAYLDFIDTRASDPDTAPTNIEAVSYLPDVFFAHNRDETAWKWMEHVYDSRDLRHVNSRQGLNGDYPEVAFTLVSQTVQGLMGIDPDAPNSWIATVPRLPEEIGWLEVADVPFGDGTVTVRHDGATRSTLTSAAGELTWQARFAGRFSSATVNGSPAEARTTEIDGVTYTTVDVALAQGESATVEVSA